MSNLNTNQRIVWRTVISFVVFALFIAGGISAWLWLNRQPLDYTKDGGIPKPLRSVLNADEKIFKKTFSDTHLAKTYPVEQAVKKVRVNGDIGMSKNFKPDEWKLKLVRKPGDTLLISLEEIKQLPKTDIVFDFKCIEGWSQVTHWGGVKFSDFAKRYNLLQDSCFDYMGLVTPDGQYYVGIDMPSAMHPQTLLCYEMNGAPLPINQGYPVRLIIPVKYGIKHLKRIGTMYFSNTRPPDYWAERGYDYYSEM